MKRYVIILYVVLVVPLVGCGNLSFDLSLLGSLDSTSPKVPAPTPTPNPAPTADDEFNFGAASDFTYASQVFTTQQNTNSAVLSSSTFSVNSAATFNAGSHLGTSYNSGTNKLELAADVASPREMASSWTPEWSDVIAYWNFNSNFNDSSTSGINLTAAGVTAIGTPEKMGGGAMSGDGADGSLAASANCAPFFSAPELSGSMWVYANSKNNDDRLIEVSSSTVPDENTRFRVALNQSADQGILVQMVDGTTAFIASSAIPLPLSTWTHVAFTFSNGLLRLYINGLLVDFSTGNGTVPAIALNADSRVAVLASAIGYSSLNGSIDEVILWKKALRASDIAGLYQQGRKTYNGIFLSKPLDSFGLAQWTDARWTSPLPFGKELSLGESASAYPDVNTSLSTGLVGLWHMNELSGSILDSSGNNNNGTNAGVVLYNKPGVFRGSADYDGGSFTSIPDAPSLAITGNISVQAWFKHRPGNSFPALITKSTDGGNFSYVLNFDGGSANLRFLIGDNAGGYDVASAASPLPYMWHHVVGVADASWVYLYIDGEEKAKVARTITAMGTTTTPLCFGSLTSSTGCDTNGYAGNIDEVGIWNRALSAADVRDLYRRGANRAKFQFRTCVASDCSDGTSWVGPDGTSATWFSEAHNAATIAASGEATGLSKLVAPIIDFANWVGAVAGFQINRTSGRYFQFKTWLESDDFTGLCGGSSCKPSISSVSANAYASIEAAKGIEFSNALPKFAVTETGDCDTNHSVRYQVSSDDGANYKYWDGAQWAAASSTVMYSQATNQADTNANIASLATAGKFRFRALVPTNSGTCTLSNPVIK